MTEQKIIIIGTGGMGRETLWMIRQHNAAGHLPSMIAVGFVTSDDGAHGTAIHGVEVLGDEEDLLSHPDAKVVCAIGDCRARRRIVDRWKTRVEFTSVVHPSALVAEGSAIGDGSIIGAQAVVMSDVQIGRHVILNVASSVSHDCVVEDFVSLAPGVRLAGGVQVEAGCDLGVQCSAIPRSRVGRGSIIGAGAVIVQDIEANCVAMGIPATVRRKLPTSEWF